MIYNFTTWYSYINSLDYPQSARAHLIAHGARTITSSLRHSPLTTEEMSWSRLRADQARFEYREFWRDSEEGGPRLRGGVQSPEIFTMTTYLNNIADYLQVVSSNFKLSAKRLNISKTEKAWGFWFLFPVTSRLRISGWQRWGGHLQLQTSEY